MSLLETTRTLLGFLAVVTSSWASAEDAPKKPELPAKIQINAVRVVVESAREAHKDAQGFCPGGPPAAIPSKKNPLPPDGLLVSGGELEVVVHKASYDTIVARRTAQRDELRLYLNGIDVTGAGNATLEVRCTTTAVLRWRVGVGEATRLLWAQLYRSNGLRGAAPLHVALGWASIGAWSEPPDPAPRLRVSVAPQWRVGLAWLLIAGLAVLSFWLAWYTDLIRDAPPAWLEQARMLKTAADQPSADKPALLLDADPTFATPSLRQTFVDAAKRAAAGELITDPAQATRAAIKLADSDKPLPKPTYSLARLQLFAWFLFAIGSAVFLWVVYGELLPITGSLVALVLITTGFKQVSTQLDASNNIAAASATASRNLLQDITTGHDQKTHVHRYQALLVNLLLLMVGVEHVWSQLTFPVFPETWLGFLVVSAVAQAGGKQAVEKPAVEGK